MKRALLIFGIVTALATIGFGQKGRTPSDPEQPANAPKPAKSSAAKGSATGNANGAASLTGGNGVINAGTALQGQLQNTIDVRRSRVGDQVVLKTVNAIKQNGQTVVPKGTQLVGRVTEITQRGKNNAESRIGVVFDRLQGAQLAQPISVSLVSITNLASSVSARDDLFGSDIMGSSSSSGTVGRGSSTSSSGGLLGGATGALDAVTNTAGSALGGVTNTVGNVATNAVNTAGGATRGVGNTVSGLRISGSASGSASGSSTVSSGDKNLHLDKGATFNLVVNN